MWRAVITDDFGPTLYFVAHETKWVWGDDTTKAKVFTDAEKQEFSLPDGAKWETVA